MKSEDLSPGDIIHSPNAVPPQRFVLDRRKSPTEDRRADLPYWPGWWIKDDCTCFPGGFADFVIDEALEDGRFVVERGMSGLVHETVSAAIQKFVDAGGDTSTMTSRVERSDNQIRLVIEGWRKP